MARKVLVSFLTLAFVLVGGLALERGARAAEAGVKVGILSCNVSSGWGFIFGSSRELRCTYAPDGSNVTERYNGSIDKFGVDIGFSKSGVIIWAVVAPTEDLYGGALAGKYIGATVEATIAVGLGANVLIGGGNSVALQPVSISGQEGLNIAAGIASVSLSAAN